MIKNFALRNVAISLIFVNIALFLVQMSFNGFTEAFLLNSSEILSRPYTLFTSMFLHASTNHLLFNMLVLFFMGPFLESRIGSKRFLIIYLVSGLVAAFSALFFYERALGASGAIMGIVAALIILMPNLKVLLFFVIPMPLWMLGILYVGVDVFGLFYPTNVANVAHLAGLATGFLFGYDIKRRIKRTQVIINKVRKKDKNDINLDDDEVDYMIGKGRF